MAASVFSAFVGLAALVGFALAVAWVRRYPPIGVALICLIIIRLWEVPAPPPIVTLAGMSFGLSDLITLLLFTVGVLEVEQLRANLRNWLFPWVVFGVLIAVALLRGVVAFEPVSAIHQARPLLYFFWSMTWVLGVRPDRLRLHTVSLVLGWMLVLVGLYHGVRYGLGGSSSVVPTVDGGFQTGRILTAPQSMALLLCAATVFLGPAGSAQTRSQLHKISSLVFGGVVVFAQHRSVWGGMAMGLVAVLIVSGRRRGRKQVLVLAVLGAWGVLVAWASGSMGGSQLLESATNRSTYEWRTSGWAAMISQSVSSGPAVVVFGDPFGSNASFRRVATTGGFIPVQAHNWYLTIFVSLGIVGLITFVAMFLAALLKSRAMPSVWTFVLAAVAAYSWAYSVDWYLVPWLGAAMAVSLGAGRTAENPVTSRGVVTSQ